MISRRLFFLILELVNCILQKGKFGQFIHHICSRTAIGRRKARVLLHRSTHTPLCCWRTEDARCSMNILSSDVVGDKSSCRPENNQHIQHCFSTGAPRHSSGRDNVSSLPRDYKRKCHMCRNTLWNKVMVPDNDYVIMCEVSDRQIFCIDGTSVTSSSCWTGTLK